MGVTTYRPPGRAKPDLGMPDAEYVIHELLVRIAQQCGYEGAQSSAIRRMTELVDDCMCRILPSLDDPHAERLTACCAVE